MLRAMSAATVTRTRLVAALLLLSACESGLPPRMASGLTPRGTTTPSASVSRVPSPAPAAGEQRCTAAIVVRGDVIAAGSGMQKNRLAKGQHDEANWPKLRDVAMGRACDKLAKVTGRACTPLDCAATVRVTVAARHYVMWWQTQVQLRPALSTFDAAATGATKEQACARAVRAACQKGIGAPCDPKRVTLVKRDGKPVPYACPVRDEHVPM